jgi:hypothetical protein
MRRKAVSDITLDDILPLIKSNKELNQIIIKNLSDDILRAPQKQELQELKSLPRKARLVYGHCKTVTDAYWLLCNGKTLDTHEHLNVMKEDMQDNKIHFWLQISKTNRKIDLTKDQLFLYPYHSYTAGVVRKVGSNQGSQIVYVHGHKYRVDRPTSILLQRIIQDLTITIPKDDKYPVIIDKYKNLLVLRDDKLPGGTKSIFLDYLMDDKYKEYIYATSAEGGFQLALSKRLGSLFTAFVAKRNKPHRNQDELRHNHSKVIEIPYGYLKNITSKAKLYHKEHPKSKLITFGGGQEYIDLIANRMQQVQLKTGKLDQVWAALGSGTLVRGILSAVPPSTQVFGVQVGMEYTGPQPQNLTIIKYPKPFKFESKLDVPFQSNVNYDRKVLEIALKMAKGRALFWNVY